MKKIICLIMCCLLTVIFSACSLFGESDVSSESTSMTDSLHDSTDKTEVSATSSESDDSKTVSEPDNSSDLSNTSQDTSASKDNISTPDDNTSTEKVFLADLGDITVYILNDEIFDKGEDVIYRHDDGDMYNITVSYTADADINEFRILNFDESEVLCISGVDAEVGDLSKGESVYSKQYVNDVTISTGFSYVNSMGETEYYHFVYSMADDSGYHIRSYENN